MSVLVYTESENGKFKKSAFEVASYAYAVAQQLGTTVTAISFNADSNDALDNYTQLLKQQIKKDLKLL